MQNPRLAARYAKSLIDLAQEQNKLEEIYGDIVTISNACAASAELRTLLKSPVIKPDAKEKILTSVFSGKVNAMTQGFITLLVRKGRESLLHDMTNAVIEQYKQIKKIFTVKLTTATAIGADVEQYLLAKIKQSSPDMQNIELQTAVDPSLIGGFKLESNNTLVDASILRDLRDVKRQFLNNDYIFAIH